jgi:glutaredoxin
MVSKTFFKLIFIFLLAQTAFSQTETKSEKKAIKNQKTAIVYGSDSCHYCIDTKKFLTEHDIKFKFYDIDQDVNALNRMLSTLRKAKIDVSSLEIPVVIYDQKIIVNGTDFNAFLDRLRETIKQKDFE